MSKGMVQSLGVAVGLIVVAMLAASARTQGLIEAETLTRLVTGATGLSLVWYGNGMPKAFVSGARARKVRRVGGWSMVLSGLAYASLWAFAPLDIAFFVGCLVVIAGLAVTVGYCLAIRRAAIV